MGKTLVLAEKPSVARELARVLGCKQKGDGCLLGGQYIVTWALGHLVTLADPEAYSKQYQSWRLEDLPMLPEKMQLVVIKQTAKQFHAVSHLMHRQDVTELIIATDAGREGELVARWIMQKAGWKGKTKRLWVSSQTDKAIREGCPSQACRRIRQPLSRRSGPRGGGLARGPQCDPRAHLQAQRTALRWARANAYARADRAARRGNPRLPPKGIFLRTGAVRRLSCSLPG